MNVMKLKLKGIVQKARHPRVRWVILASVLLGALFLFKLGLLTSGISQTELQAANKSLGWHGLYHDPLNASINFLRSGVFCLYPNFDAGLLRLSNAIFGIIGVIAFYFVIRSWHGYKIAWLTTLMFATSAFTLHVSRVATYDVMYFIAVPLIFFNYLLLRKYPGSKWAFLFSLAVWLNLIYTPGLVWLAFISMYAQKDCLTNSFKALNKVWKSVSGAFVAAALGLLGYLLYLNHDIMRWLGLPESFASPLMMLKQFAGVFVHLFVRGPQYPEIWLGRAPVLDVFALAMCIIGIYFYATHLSASRTKALYLYGGVGIILVALNGPVSFALLVPLLFFLISTGITYIRQQWLYVFPANPIARNFGIGLILIAIGFSCIYNLRSYFIAWPHNKTTQATFSYNR